MKRVAVLMLVIASSLLADIRELERFASPWKVDKVVLQSIYDASVIVEKEVKIDKKLIWSLIAVESEFKNITNYTNSIGYCQVQLSTSKYVYDMYKLRLAKYIVRPTKIASLKHIRTNVLLAGFYLDYLQKLTGSRYNALRAYNAGPSGYKMINNDWYYRRIMKYRMTL